MTISEDELLKQLAIAKKARRAAIRAERAIYYGREPCAMRAKDPAFDAACATTERATANYNVIADRINTLRGLMKVGSEPDNENGFAQELEKLGFRRP